MTSRQKEICLNVVIARVVIYGESPTKRHLWQRFSLEIALPALWLPSSGEWIQRFMHVSNIWTVTQSHVAHGPLARYVKLWVTHAPGLPGTFSPPPRVSDPDMHHGTCVTHVPWRMPGSLTRGFLWSRRRGKTFPAFPAHVQPAILRIWQEAHDSVRARQSSDDK